MTAPRLRSRPLRLLAFVSTVALTLALPGKDKVDEVADRILQNPDFSSVTLSPDGSHLGMYVYDHDVRTIGTYDLNKHKGRTLRLDKGRSAYRFGWLDGDRIIFSVAKWGYYHEGLFTIDEALKATRQPDKDRGYTRIFTLIDPLPGVPGQAFVYDTLSKPYRTFYRYTENHGFDELIDRREMLIHSAFDLAGNFRVKVLGTGAPNEYTAFLRANDDSPWKRIDLPDLVDLNGFNYTGTILYVSYEKDGHTILQGYDTEAEAFVGGAIADQNYAVLPRVLRAHDTGDVIGIAYDADLPIVTYIEPNIAAAARLLSRSLPEMRHFYMGIRDNGGLLFYSYSDRQPGIVHELNPKERQLKRVLETRPGIEAEEMAPMIPFTFPSRDGETIRGYYTLPFGSDPEKPTRSPLITIVHGGPRARDTWGFDQEVQFFAHLGYTVLQVNYRGSEGMYEKPGRRFTLLDACQYGVDDVVDGVNYMVEKGFADPNRMVIYGWSFGGYSAVACAARYPDLFNAAYAAGGVYDWNEIWREEERDGFSMGYLQWDEDFVGNLEENEEAYRAASPVYLASKIKIPVYLLHGEADGVVGTRQSRMMYRALIDAGVEVELETPGWLHHGPQNEAERLKFTKQVFRFLDKYNH